MTRQDTSGRRTTIYDLARLVDASPSAVSAVLNGTWEKRRISRKLADRVLEVADTQGYARNIQASLLRRETSHIVGMIIPKYDNRYFGAIAEQFEARARERGLFPVITCTQRDPDLELAAARELIAYRADCLVSTGATNPDRVTELCAAAGIRTVNLDLPGSDAPSVISDNEAAARDLTNLILDRGRDELGWHGPLLFVGGRASDHNTGARLRGFLKAHHARGLAVPNENVLTCGYAAAKAEQALGNLASLTSPAIFVNSTITLEGVVRWLDKQDKQYRFGCFDWDPFAALLKENVGMVQQDVDAMLDETFEVIESDDRGASVKRIACRLNVLNAGISD